MIGAAKYAQPHNEDVALGLAGGAAAVAYFYWTERHRRRAARAADALAASVQMLDMTLGFHHTMLVRAAEIQDPRRDRGRAAVGRGDCHQGRQRPKYIERIMRVHANGRVQAGDPEPAGHRFVNTALSAVLRVDHPEQHEGDGRPPSRGRHPAWGKLVEFLEDPKGPIAWDAIPEISRSTREASGITTRRSPSRRTSSAAP